jgi:hypothetical protein
VEDQGLGRVYRPDPRDRNHLLADELQRRQKREDVKLQLLTREETEEGDPLISSTLTRSARSAIFDGGKPLAAAEAALRTRPWVLGPVLNQGSTSQCVLHAWLGWAFAAPLAQAPPNFAKAQYERKAGRIVSANAEYTRTWTTNGYNWAQRNDEWPGENYDGTSVRAGAEYLRGLGIVTAYKWAWDVDTCIAWLRSKQGGTLVLGTDWFTGMDRVDSKGFVDVSGQWRGGHAWLVYWFSEKLDAFYALNSWGPKYGRAEQPGTFLVRRPGFQYLLEGLNGEACAALQRAA